MAREDGGTGGKPSAKGKPPAAGRGAGKTAGRGKAKGKRGNSGQADQATAAKPASLVAKALPVLVVVLGIAAGLGLTAPGQSARAQAVVAIATQFPAVGSALGVSDAALTPADASSTAQSATTPTSEGGHRLTTATPRLTSTPRAGLSVAKATAASTPLPEPTETPSPLPSFSPTGTATGTATRRPGPPTATPRGAPTATPTPIDAGDAVPTVKSFLRAINEGRATRALAYWLPDLADQARAIVEPCVARQDQYTIRDVKSRWQADLGVAEVQVVVDVTSTGGPGLTGVLQTYQLEYSDAAWLISARTQ